MYEDRILKMVEETWQMSRLRLLKPYYLHYVSVSLPPQLELRHPTCEKVSTLSCEFMQISKIVGCVWSTSGQGHV